MYLGLDMCLLFIKEMSIWDINMEEIIKYCIVKIFCYIEELGVLKNMF